LHGREWHMIIAPSGNAFPDLPGTKGE